MRQPPGDDEPFECESSSFWSIACGPLPMPVWTDGPFPYSFFTRYLDQFEQVEVVARVQPVSEPSSSWVRADGDRVSFAPVPYYVGPREYLRRRQAVAAAVELALEGDNAVVLRAPWTACECCSQELDPW